MERRRHKRISVNVNAVLLVKATMPRGCRVGNVSQHGMLLQWGPGKQPASLSMGDTVEIRLSLRRLDDARESLSLSAVVRHIQEDGIGVEFQRPQPQLVELIESSSSGENDKLNASIAPAKGAPSSLRSRKPGAGLQEEGLTPPGWGDASWQNLGHMSLHFRVLLLTLTAAVLIGAYSWVIRLGDRLNSLEATMTGQARHIGALRDRLAEYQELEKKLAQLNTRMQGLAHTVAAHQQRLTGMAPQRQAQVSAVDSALVATTLSRAPAPDPERADPERADPGTPVTSDSPRHSRARAEPAADGAVALQADATESATGAWVINLLSSPNKAAVERFAGQARAQDIAVEQRRVRVKGREFWRVQVSGFATANAARYYAESAKAKLGLKDVWIFKR
jgi:uncharacterized coiled-coil protein SlyX